MSQRYNDRRFRRANNGAEEVSVTNLARRVAEGYGFQNFILGVILVTAVIVSTMLRSIPSMGHILMMLGLLLYVYGVLGFYLFRGHDPERWGTFGAALLTPPQMLTLEGLDLRLCGGLRGGQPLRDLREESPHPALSPEGRE